MSTYQYCRLDDAGMLHQAASFTATDDVDAILMAHFIRAKTHGADFELWSGERMVWAFKEEWLH